MNTVHARVLTLLSVQKLQNTANNKSVINLAMQSQFCDSFWANDYPPESNIDFPNLPLVDHFLLGKPMGFQHLWDFYGISMEFLWDFYGFHGISMRFLYVYLRISNPSTFTKISMDPCCGAGASSLDPCSCSIPGEDTPKMRRCGGCDMVYTGGSINGGTPMAGFRMENPIKNGLFEGTPILGTPHHGKNGV